MDEDFLRDLLRNIPAAGAGVAASALGAPMDMVYGAADLMRQPPLKMQGAERPFSSEWFLKNWAVDDLPSAQMATMVPVGAAGIKQVAKPKAWKVIDSLTGRLVGTYKVRGMARAKADKMDLEYGAIRTKIDPVWPEE